MKNKLYFYKMSYAAPLILMTVIFSTIAFAKSPNDFLKQTKSQSSQTQAPAPDIEYYLIVNPLDENSKARQQSQPNINPLEIIKAVTLQVFAINSENDFNLLEWIYHKNDTADDYEPYDRKSQFGSWIKDPEHNTCLNVRGLVLVRDAHADVIYDEDNHCRVKSSEWTDPYTHEELYSADDIQIDHVVPLKNAYISGAWNWSNPQRCSYANYLGNNFHLLSVLGSENSKKGDRSPHDYEPPYSDFVCQYVLDWLKIKSIWQLRISVSEAEGIKEVLKEHSCSLSEFKLSLQEIQKQRSLSQDIPDGCENR